MKQKVSSDSETISFVKGSIAARDDKIYIQTDSDEDHLGCNISIIRFVA